MKAYSMDLRERVLAACDAGMGTKEAAERFGVCESWLRRLKLPLKKSRGTPPSRTAPTSRRSDSGGRRR